MPEETQPPTEVSPDEAEAPTAPVLPPSVDACPPCRAITLGGGLYRPATEEESEAEAFVPGERDCGVCEARKATAMLVAKSPEERAKEEDERKEREMREAFAPAMTVKGGSDGDAPEETHDDGAAEIGEEVDLGAHVPSVSSDPNAGMRPAPWRGRVCGDCRSALEPEGATLVMGQEIGLGHPCDVHTQLVPGSTPGLIPQATNVIDLPVAPNETAVYRAAWAAHVKRATSPIAGAVARAEIVRLAGSFVAAAITKEVERLGDAATADAAVILARQLVAAVDADKKE